MSITVLSIVTQISVIDFMYIIPQLFILCVNDTQGESHPYVFMDFLLYFFFICILLWGFLHFGVTHCKPHEVFLLKYLYVKITNFGTFNQLQQQWCLA